MLYVVILYLLVRQINHHNRILPFALSFLVSQQGVIGFNGLQGS